MRIISGKYKGKRLVAPKKLPVRPTTDFAKEALFNILMHRLDFEEITLLDLYAGTGNISYEFGSRGTNDITAIDSYYGCVKYINSIAEELNFLFCISDNWNAVAHMNSDIRILLKLVVKYLTNRNA